MKLLIKLFAAIVIISTSLALIADDSVLIVNDITQLNPVKVKAAVAPKTLEELIKTIAESTGPISIGGGRYSQGGQTSYPNSLHLDMRQFNKVLSFDINKKEIKVQAGITWRDIQEYIDPHYLSVKIMQTYTNFTVGGSLSVNAHGRYVGEGPIINSVKEITLVLANGELKHASRNDNQDLFYAAIGGYGGIGVIAEVVLLLEGNAKIKRKDIILDITNYKQYFLNNIRDDSTAIFSNAEIYLPGFNKVRSITWHLTDEPLTQPLKLIPKNKSYYWESKIIGWIANHSSGHSVRRNLIEPLIYAKSPVVWRNYEASYDVRRLEPKNRNKTTYGLREYFIPINQFETFIEKMQLIIKEQQVNIINISIRHSPADTESLLSWAPKEVFSFVIYYSQGTSQSDIATVGNWTRELNDAAISLNGTYYLPYQIHETTEQFKTAYPRYKEYFLLKKRVDPDFRFINALWETHYKN
jgi:FAD/FMN-containing dehydrogenase